MKQKLITLCCLAGIAGILNAQNTTNLPTSMYGIGELSMGDGGHYTGLGNMGISLNRIGHQNTHNPAAITRMDTACFTFDVGITTSYSRYSFLSQQSSNTSGNPNRINIGFRLLPRWYIILGMAPYSSVGYVIQSEDEVEGTNGQSLYSLFSGTGGLYRAYITNALALTKQLSIGANVGFVSGTITQDETQENSTIQYESYKRALYLDFGLHYEFRSSAQQQWSIGLVYAPSSKLYQDNDLVYYSSSTGESMDVTFHKNKQYLPQKIGLGISSTTKRWIMTADYNWLDWSKNSSSHVMEKYQNQHKVNLGGIYITNPRYPRSVELMGGVGFSNSYIMLDNGKMHNLEVSAGASFPIRYSYLSIGGSWKKQLNSRKDLMQETRWSLHMNLTFGEKISRFKIK